LLFFIRITERSWASNPVFLNASLPTVRSVVAISRYGFIESLTSTILHGLF